MGISIQDSTATFTYFFAPEFGSQLPDDPNLLGKWVFNKSTYQQSAVNQITGVAAQIVGTPLQQTTTVQVSEKTGFIADVSPSANRTYVVIGKAVTPSSTDMLVYSEQDYSTTSGRNVGLLLGRTRLLSGTQGGSIARIEYANLTANVSDVCIYVATLSSSKSIIYVSDGTNTNTAVSNAGVNLAVNPLRLGAYDTANSLSGFNGGKLDLHLAAVYNKELTVTEIESIISNFTGYLLQQNSGA